MVAGMSRHFLPLSICLLALTQVPAACESIAVLECQKRFLEIAASQEPIREAIAVRFCLTPSEGREAF